MSLEMIAAQVTRCVKCDLSKNRKNAVPGVGSPNARVMIIGEAPGAEEDAQGLPFVGRAGVLFNSVLGDVGLHRTSVFVTNTVKCRPPRNRKPSRREMKTCLPYLKSQIGAINPQVIVLLGNTAAEDFFMKEEMPHRGKLVVQGERLFLFTYHPAACMRNPDCLPILRSHLRGVATYISRHKDHRRPKGLDSSIR